MRIAHVTDCYLPRLGGMELQVHDLAQRQAARHDVSVITSTPGRRGTTGCPEPGLIRIGRPGRREQSIRYRSSEAGARWVAGAGFDLVHVHVSTFSPLAYLTAHHASRRGVPTVATLHSQWGPAATLLLTTADGLIGWGAWPVAWSAVSEAAATALRRVLGHRANVAVLPNGIDPKDWSVSHEARPPGQLRIAVVCRLTPRKRPYQLVQTVRAARERLPESVELSVDIAGDGPERGRIERYLRRHRMGWVHLRGRLTREQIRSMYAGSDLFVAPARFEAFGIAALEARSAGLPILARTGTGIGEFVTHGLEGWLVGSDQEMLETLVLLGTSQEPLERVAAHNRETPPRAGWPSVLSSCEALYQAAARGNGHGNGRGGIGPATPPASAAGRARLVHE